MPPPPTSSRFILSPVFPVTADRVCMMKIWRSELQGNAKAKLFYPEQSEINPAEMEMRHNERMNSGERHRWATTGGGRGRRRVVAVTNPKTCFNLLKMLCQQTGLNPITPSHILFLSSVLLWPTQENVNKLGTADRIKPFAKSTEQ